MLPIDCCSQLILHSDRVPRVIFILYGMNGSLAAIFGPVLWADLISGCSPTSRQINQGSDGIIFHCAQWCWTQHSTHHRHRQQPPHLRKPALQRSYLQYATVVPHCHGKSFWISTASFQEHIQNTEATQHDTKGLSVLWILTLFPSGQLKAHYNLEIE